MGACTERKTFGVMRENCCMTAFHTVSDLRVDRWTDKEGNSFKEGRRERRIKCSLCASKYACERGRLYSIDEPTEKLQLYRVLVLRPTTLMF